MSTTSSRGATWVLNSFSLNLLGGADNAHLVVRRVPIDEARRLAVTARSAVGHEDTAEMFSSLLGVPVSFNRETVTLGHGETALVGQYSGPRLEITATSRPAGALVHWYTVTLLLPAAPAVQ